MDAWNPAVRPLVNWLGCRTARPPQGRCVCLLIVLSLVGCRADPNMQLVERELRLQDNRIFELEEHLADCHSVVEEYRREIASLRRRIGDKDSPEINAEEGPLDSDFRLRPDLPEVPSLPDVEEGDETRFAPPDPALDGAPSLENGAPDADATEMPDTVPFRGDPPQPTPADPEQGISSPASSRRDSGEGDVVPSSEELPPPNLTGAADDIEQIHLRLMVRYHVAENTPLQLQALVQPQDEGSQRVMAAGDVSLMVVAMDDGAERQLGRWDFPQDAAKRHWRRSRLGSGLQFHLPWPVSPRPGVYRLWVRLVGADGRKHFGTADFEIEGAALARSPELTLPAPLPRPAQQAAAPVPVEERDRTSRASQRNVAADEQEIAWKPSVLAAKLAGARPRRPTLAAEGELPPSEPALEDQLIPWSPERPSTRGASGDLQTANTASEWSPFR